MPFGDEADPRTKQFFPSSSEAAVVKWMFDQAAAGKTPAEIADAANANGWRTKQRTARRTGTRHGGNLWTARQVIATLRNPVYLGCFETRTISGSATTSRLRQAYVAGHHPVSELTLSILQVPLDSWRAEALRRSGFRNRYRRCAAAESGTALGPWGLRLDAKQIQDHVESVVYDHRDQKARVKVIQPPEPDAETDSAEVKIPLGKRGRRNPLTPV